MKTSTSIMAAVLAIFACAVPAAAQREERSLSCDRESSNRNRLVTHCEMREQTVAFAGRLSVDPGMNGGVSIKGWDQPNVLIRSKVEASAVDESTAKVLSAQIHVDYSGSVVTTNGPSNNRDQNWSVSHEIFVPRNADLDLKTVNGGISISGVRGNIRFTAKNGGVSLKRVAGDVEGTTQNGGLAVELAGNHWDGNKLDVRTVNGGVNVSMPQNYSAHLETATTNGNLNVDFPMTVHGEIGKTLVTDIGSGGPTIHIETKNGGVNVKRAM